MVVRVVELGGRRSGSSLIYPSWSTQAANGMGNNLEDEDGDDVNDSMTALLKVSQC